MSKRKKALVVVNLAGFLTFLWNDIDILKKMGFEVSVAMDARMKDGSIAIEIQKLQNLGIPYYQIDFDTKNPFSRNNIVAYKQLKMVLKQKFDVVHCHTPIVGLLTRLAANKYRKMGSKVIYTTHGFTFTDKTSKKSWLIFYNLEKLASRFCDAIITINHEDYNNAKTMHCDKVFVIPSVGLDLARFKNLKIDRNAYRQSLGVTDKDKMILAVGELSSRKNHRIIIEALQKVQDKEKYIFVICGRAVVNSNIEKELKDLASKCGVRLVLAGHRGDIPQINACADIAVIPSTREGLGMAGLEALASKVPVIGSDVQGIREYVVEDVTGYLCDPYDAATFAKAIETLDSLSDQKLETMKNNCLKMAEKFDITNSTKVMTDIYNEMLS